VGYDCLWITVRESAVPVIELVIRHLLVCGRDLPAKYGANNAIVRLYSRK
jgi:hypothetical protein